MSGKREHPKEGRKNWIICRMIMFSGIGYIVVHEKNGIDHEIRRMQKTGCSPILQSSYQFTVHKMVGRWWEVHAHFL